MGRAQKISAAKVAEIYNKNVHATMRRLELLTGISEPNIRKKLAEAAEAGIKLRLSNREIRRENARSAAITAAMIYNSKCVAANCCIGRAVVAQKLKVPIHKFNELLKLASEMGMVIINQRSRKTKTGKAANTEKQKTKHNAADADVNQEGEALIWPWTHIDTPQTNNIPGNWGWGKYAGLTDPGYIAGNIAFFAGRTNKSSAPETERTYATVADGMIVCW